MIYAILLLLGQVGDGQGAPKVSPITVTVENATINMQCECTPCYWDCIPERTLLKQNKDMIAMMDVQIQQLQLSLKLLTGAETPLPSWCFSFLEMCDKNRSGRVDLWEFAMVQRAGGQR